jgi:hypothetical protein
MKPTNPPSKTHKISRFAKLESKLAKNSEITISTLDHRVFQMFKADKTGIRRIFGRLLGHGPHFLIVQHNFGKYRYDTGYDINDYWICDHFLGMVSVWDKDTRTERLLPLQYYLVEKNKGRSITREPVETLSFEEFGLPIETTAEILELQATVNTELQGLSRDYISQIAEEKPVSIQPNISSTLTPLSNGPPIDVDQTVEEAHHKPLRLSRRKKAKLSALFK